MTAEALSFHHMAGPVAIAACAVLLERSHVMLRRSLIALLIIAFMPAFALGSQHLTGELGHLNMAKAQGSLHASAEMAMQGILMERFGADGTEEMTVTKIFTDELGGMHVRFQQKLNGLEVVGGDMVMHVHADGAIYGLNGDFAKAARAAISPKIDSETAFAGMAKANRQRVGAYDLVYVLRAGNPILSWRTTLEYVDAQGPQRDIVFVDALTGKIAARHPQFHYARSLQTQDCNQKTKNCSTVSTSSNTISTGDLAIDSAHNYAIGTYDYYLNNHGRDSIDDNGMTLISRVHYDRNYNNAFWDGAQMTYGDGDGTTFVPLSQDADVVAHELTHGVTERSSGLIYQNESGALNEALSDIFGAMVDRQEGATGADMWLLGEDIYTPAIPGDGLRDMAFPSAVGDYDCYPDRYTGTSDNGGVHWNSGIANLAFVLLVEGGSHPASSGSCANNPGPNGIGFAAAAEIFYNANVGCLTSGSNFAAARYCTADVFGGAHAAAVHAAWDAVEVPNDPPPPPPEPIEIFDGQAVNGVSLDTGVTQDYFLNGIVSGDTVTCSTSCNNGDADLYLRFGQAAETNPNSNNNACGSYTANSNESCTTGAASGNTSLWAAVQAYSGFSNLSLTCTVSGGSGSCDPAGSPCGNCCNGCSGGKPSSRVCL